MMKLTLWNSVGVINWQSLRDLIYVFILYFLFCMLQINNNEIKNEIYIFSHKVLNYKYSMQMSNSNDHVRIKDLKYKAEQDKIFNAIKTNIKYDDDNNSFIVSNIDRSYILNNIYPQIKNYVHFDVWGRIDVDNPKSHISLVKKIFIDRGFTLLLKTETVIDDKGSKTKVKKYYVL